MIRYTNSIGFMKHIILVFTLIFSFARSAEFHEEASAIIAASLENQPKKSFLKEFYERLYFVPVWTHENSLSNFSNELFKQIDADKTLGPDSKISQNALIISSKKAGYADLAIEQKIRLEFEIAQLYKNYINHMLNGNINWSAFKGKLVNPQNEEEINGGWITYGSPFNALNIMQDAIVNGSLSDTLSRAMPKDFNYPLMEKELIKYLKIKQNGGWAQIPAIKGSIKIGQKNAALPLIRERLRSTGELDSCAGPKEPKLYDKCLQKAIMKFQKNNGINNSNGSIDKRTAKALRESVDQRISKIRLNMDRIKWLNHRFEPRSIMINIPDFKFTFIENNKARKEMKVIVGDKKHHTPVFSNRVSYIVLNPYWNVPKSIIQKEFIPKLLKNPNAMIKEHIDVTRGWDRDEPKINPATIEWSQYQYSKTVPFRFAQPPGNGNALGRIKFLFPNNFAVYMHDTPTKRLFNEDVRAFSHGCIRLAEPMELLKIIASIDSKVNLARANEILKGKTETTISLNNSIPVDIVYLTAWVDYDGELQFRDDVYGYDELQKP